MHIKLNQLSIFYLYFSPQLRRASSFTVLANSEKKQNPLNINRSFNQPTRITSNIHLSNNSSDQDSNIGLTEIGANEEISDSRGDKAATMEAESISSWREKIEVSITKSRKIRGGNYVQIATVDPTTLEPRCRTVVFRGFFKHRSNAVSSVEGSLPFVMKMITDKRSNKFSEVTTNDKNNERASNTVEMVWWFAKSSEQYRIRGQLKFVGEDEKDQNLLIARKEQWGNLSDMAREQFYWVDPGLNFDESDTALNKIPAGGRDEDGKVLPPPENFLLMLLHPKRCDYLRLTDNFRQIDHLKEDKWETSRVNP